MKRQISGTSLPGRKTGLWTPWGVLRLAEPDRPERDTERNLRRRPARKWIRPAVMPSIREHEPLG